MTLMPPAHKSLLAALALGLTAAAPFACGQDTPPPAPPPSDAAAPADQPPPPPPKGRKGRDQIRAVLTKIDNLTDDQKAKIADIQKDTMAKGREIRNDTTLSDDEKREKTMANTKAGLDQVRALLTPDQQKQFDDAVASLGRRRKRSADGDAGAPPPPPPADGSAPPPPPSQ